MGLIVVCGELVKPLQNPGTKEPVKLEVPNEHFKPFYSLINLDAIMA